MPVTIAQIQEAVARTREARDRVFPHRNTEAIIVALAQTARNWLQPGSVWRSRAIERAPAPTGFSREMISEAVDLTFGAITEQALKELLVAYTPHLDPLPQTTAASRRLGSPQGERKQPRIDINSPIAALSSPSPRPSGGEAGIASASTGEGEIRRTTGPHLIVHFLAGNVPPPGIASICWGLLLKSANLVKISSRDPVFPALFVESLREVDAELADCVAVLDWRRDELALTKAALEEADTVTAYGDDETIAALQKMCRPETRFLGFGHKLSFAVIAKEAMTKESLPGLAEAAAFDASIYDQQGCMSPHAIYVEEGGQLSPREFAAALAEAMATYQARVPRGQLSLEEAAQIAKLRGAYEFRSATDRTVEIWASKAANDWLVIYEEDPMFTPSCLNRTVFVKPTNGFKRVLDNVRRFAGKISTVGLASMNEHAMAFAGDLARMGVHRVCPIGQMQRPPVSSQRNG